MADRFISENALLVLLTGKVEALQDRIIRLNAKENPTLRDVKREDEAHAQIDALCVVMAHLRFVPDENGGYGRRSHVPADGAESAECPFVGGNA